MKFPDYIADFLDNNTTHIKIQDTYIIIYKLDTDTNKFKHLHTFRRDGDCIEFNPTCPEEHALIFAIAIKAKYLVIPKVWEKISKWSIEQRIRCCLMRHPTFGDEQLKVKKQGYPAIKFTKYELKWMLSQMLLLEQKAKRPGFPAVKKSDNNPFRT